MEDENKSLIAALTDETSRCGRIVQDYLKAASKSVGETKERYLFLARLIESDIAGAKAAQEAGDVAGMTAALEFMRSIREKTK